MAGNIATNTFFLRTLTYFIYIDILQSFGKIINKYINKRKQSHDMVTTGTYSIAELTLLNIYMHI